mmetsp:Transcript_2560/g.4028  ORF Transcript_2560/g.4028 Transcript_2560/m.4028 type:complete len:200 (+) Transcript_2560:2-601(+)
MLSFYRSAACPLCNYAIDELQGRYKKLAWAAKLDVIAVFQSSTENIDRFILKSRDTTKDKFPFKLLSDSEMATYADYKVGSSSTGFMKGYLNLKIRGYKELKEYYKTHKRINGFHKETVNRRLPSDFLIDENGVIVDFFRAKAINEHIPLERIDSFLMFGRIVEMNDETKKSKTRQRVASWSPRRTINIHRNKLHASVM